jgi:hypothetical protein
VSTDEWCSAESQTELFRAQIDTQAVSQQQQQH